MILGSRRRSSGGGVVEVGERIVVGWVVLVVVLSFVVLGSEVGWVWLFEVFVSLRDSVINDWRFLM